MRLVTHIGMLRIIAICIGPAQTLPAAAFDFDWGSIGWVDGSTATQVFTNVDSSGVDVTVRVSGSTGRFVSGAPSLFDVAGNDELRSFVDFINTSESVTFEISFSEPVTVEEFAIKDIDSGLGFFGGFVNYSDAVRIEGIIPLGLDIPPVTATAGSAVNTISLREYDSRTNTGLDYPDPRGWVTTGFTGVPVDALRFIHSSGPTFFRNPSAQAVTLSDFQFFTDTPLEVTKETTSPTPVTPGDNAAFQISITNNRDVIQTGIDVADVLRGGSSYVARSTVVNGFTGGGQASDDFQAELQGGFGWVEAAWNYIDDAGTDPGRTLIVPEAGRIRFNGSAVDEPYISRTAAADLTAAASITLEFDLEDSGNLEPNDDFAVWASTDGGASWTPIIPFFDAGSYTPGRQSIDLSGFASDQLAVRFEVATIGVTADEAFFLDNVEIIGEAVPITRDNDPGSANDNLVNGSPPAVVRAADGFVLPAGETMTVSYSTLVDDTDPAPIAAVNLVAAGSDQYLLGGQSGASVAVDSCSGSDSGASEIPIVSADDDGYWDDSGRPKFTGNTILLANAAEVTASGFRFQGINIPAGSTVTGAVLSYNPSSNSQTGGTPSAVIRAQDTADAPPFSGSPPAALTNTSVPYNPGDWTNNDRRATPDLSALLQELVDRYGGLEDAAVSIVLQATGDATRSVSGRSGSADDPPGLTVSFGCPPSDRGDAPVSYGDPRHRVSGAPTVFIGAPGDEPDTESPTPHSIGADGDDSSGDDDENGVVFRSSTGTPQELTADITVTFDADVNVCSWLDLDNSGTFDFAEGRCRSVVGGPATLSISSSWEITPSTVLDTYFRVRVTTDTISLGDAIDSGVARPDGEVEDYRVVYDPTAVTLGDIALTQTRVTDFLDGIAASRMPSARLADMLTHWDPDSAAAVDPLDRDALLAAMTAYLDPDGDGRVAVLAWETLEERGTVGFYAERREPGGPWQRINPRLLPGLITAPLGGEYRLADPGAASGKDYQYRLLEVEAQGWEREYGPFTLRLD